LNEDDADGSHVFGRINTSDSFRATTVGSGNFVSGDYANTLGYGNKVTDSGDRSYTLGMENFNNAENAFIIGSGNTNHKKDTTTVGYGNLNEGSLSMIFGYENHIQEDVERASIFGRGITLGINDAFQFGPNESGKITILENGHIGIGATGEIPFEDPQELLHLYDGNVLFESKDSGGEVRFYNNLEEPEFHNPSQDDIRFVVSGANQRIQGDLILSTGIGDKGQTLHGRIFQEASHYEKITGMNWGRAPFGPTDTCDYDQLVFHPNKLDTIIGTDGSINQHKVGVHAAEDFCNTLNNPDSMMPEPGRRILYAPRPGDPHGVLYNVEPTGAIFARYTIYDVPEMDIFSAVLPSAELSSGAAYTVKNVGKGKTNVFVTGEDKLDILFTGFMIEARFESHTFISDGNGWFIV
jgi:hypothetical protein